MVQKIGSGELSIRDNISGYIENIKSKNEDINALIYFNETDIEKQISILEGKLSNGEKLGKLFGVPIVIKDNINIIGTKTTCGSKILENYTSVYDATVIENLKKEDCIIIGKSNMDEFAMGSSNETSYFGNVKNPLDLERVPGGSSGGSAAAVASGMAPIALGSDTGGSIRQPAGNCGIVGLKPTYGRVSRYGLVAFASSLDQIGTFSTNVEDSSYLLEILAGYDEKDSTSVEKDVDKYSNFEIKDLSKVKIGIPKEFFGEGLDPKIRKVIDTKIENLKSQGCEIVEVSLPHTDYAVSVYYILATAEASSNLSRYDGVKFGHRSDKTSNLTEMYTNTKEEGFGDEVKRRIMLGTYVLSAGYYDAYYNKALKVRTLIKQDFENVFKNVDVLLAPVTPTLPFKFGEKSDDPLEMYLSDIYTISTNLAGIPGLSVPIGNIGDLSVGVQLLGNYFDEKKLLNIAKLIEKK